MHIEHWDAGLPRNNVLNSWYRAVWFHPNPSYIPYDATPLSAHSWLESFYCSLPTGWPAMQERKNHWSQTSDKTTMGSLSLNSYHVTLLCYRYIHFALWLHITPTLRHEHAAPTLPNLPRNWTLPPISHRVMSVLCMEKLLCGSRASPRRSHHIERSVWRSLHAPIASQLQLSAHHHVFLWQPRASFRRSSRNPIRTAGRSSAKRRFCLGLKQP